MRRCRALRRGSGAGVRLACLVGAGVLLAGCGAAHRPAAPARSTTAPAARAAAASATGRSGLPASRLPSTRARFVATLDAAQAIIDRPSSTPGELAGAGFFEQLVAGALAAAPPRVRRATLAMLTPRAAASIGSDLAAAAALSAIVPAERSLPPWRIVAPPAPNTLLSYFRSAEARLRRPVAVPRGD